MFFDGFFYGIVTGVLATLAILLTTMKRRQIKQFPVLCRQWIKNSVRSARLEVNKLVAQLDHPAYRKGRAFDQIYSEVIIFCIPIVCFIFAGLASQNYNFSLIVFLVSAIILKVVSILFYFAIGSFGLLRPLPQIPIGPNLGNWIDDINTGAWSFIHAIISLISLLGLVALFVYVAFFQNIVVLWRIGLTAFLMGPVIAISFEVLRSTCNLSDWTLAISRSRIERRRRRRRDQFLI